MRRYISLACVALIVVTCMVSPVRASESYDFYYECLDYHTISDSNNRFNYSSSNFDVEINFPFYYDWISIDSVVYSSSPFSVSCGGIPLYVEYLYDDLYRIYGTLPDRFMNSAVFSFVSNNSTGSIYFYSVRVFTRGHKITNIPLEGTGTYSGGSFDMSKNFGDSRPLRTVITNTDFDNRDFILYLYSYDWRKYDYIQFQTYLTVESIDSISCVFGSSVIPFDINYIFPSSSDQTFYVTITIDCRNLDKTLSDDFYPMVIITGKEIFDGVSLIALMDSCGFVLTDSISDSALFLDRFRIWFHELNAGITGNFNSLFYSLRLYFENLESWFTNQTSSILSDLSSHFSNLNSWISLQISTMQSEFAANRYYLELWIDEQTSVLESAIRGDTSPGDSFQDEVDEKDQQLNDMAAVMDSVSRPDLNSVNVSADSYVDGTVLAASMSGITSVIAAPVFLDVIMMSLIMATAGYVLFGKR